MSKKNTPVVRQKTTLLIQLDSELKRKFQNACSEQDSSVSHNIRLFMRHFVFEQKKKKRNLDLLGKNLSSELQDCPLNSLNMVLLRRNQCLLHILI